MKVPRTEHFLLKMPTAERNRPSRKERRRLSANDLLFGTVRTIKKFRREESYLLDTMVYLRITYLFLQFPCNYHVQVTRN